MGIRWVVDDQGIGRSEGVHPQALWKAHQGGGAEEVAEQGDAASHWCSESRAAFDRGWRVGSLERLHTDHRYERVWDGRECNE